MRALRGECTYICCRIYPSGLHQDFISATYNKSHRLCPQIADNTQSDCLQGHPASHSALHHGWIDPSLLMSAFYPHPPTLTLLCPVYIYASVHSLCFTLKSIWMYFYGDVCKWKIVACNTTAEMTESGFPVLPHRSGVHWNGYKGDLTDQQIICSNKFLQKYLQFEWVDFWTCTVSHRHFLSLLHLSFLSSFFYWENKIQDKAIIEFCWDYLILCLYFLSVHLSVMWLYLQSGS